ncbi:MAG TPA: glycoside hydrolase family 88 protein [Acidobacteriaceae bacterium]
MKSRIVLLMFCFAVTMPLVGQSYVPAVTAMSVHASATDISRSVVDATITRLPTAADLGPWEYSRALFLLGELSVYQRTHDSRYLDYAKAWADAHSDAKGNVDHPIEALDFIMPGNVDITLYQITGDARYKRTAEKIDSVFTTYPRTEDGGFWHASNNGREHQLWGDGTFMALPFLIRAGAMNGRSADANREAVKQLLIYDRHLRDPHGPLFFHAYDASGKATWANSDTHHSAVKWGRAIGWYCVALTEVLDALPAEPLMAQDKADRQKLIVIAQNLARDLTNLQDPETGLWFQIIDKPKLPGNFVETSSSSMFTYFLDVAVKHGYIDASYHSVAERGYRGVMSKVILGADGHYHVTGICEGTNVGTQEDYLARKVYVDDFHGLGAFLLMNEEVQYNKPEMRITVTTR